MEYEYATNNLENPRFYDYSKFYGVGFLKAYLKNRLEFLNVESLQNKPLESLEILQKCLFDERLLRLVIKTFEVNKRLYNKYTFTLSSISNAEILKPDKNSGYENLDNYLALSCALVKFYKKSKNLLFLNTLLKLNDILISQQEFLEKTKKWAFYESISCEVWAILGLLSLKLDSNYLKIAQQLEINFKDFKEKDKKLPLIAKNKIEILSGVAMVFALCERSFMYLEILRANGLLPSRILLLGGDCEAIRKLENVCVEVIPTKDINSETAICILARIPEEFIVYSGYAGGILSKEHFSYNKKFIHIHAGSLPYFKGSTTCYYSLLEQGTISASAIFLSRDLDCGDILGCVSLSKEQIKKLNNTDIDMQVEPYIRGLALVKVLQDFKRDSTFRAKKQEGLGETYYRIHPVLKHIAILNCFKD
ncbi:MAG: hypothetical protein SOW25_00110 [Helicobacter sp.]|nr:hypothetical protein [Helicobacter sp.]